MARDETRFIGGAEARRLRLPGQTIIENPGVLDRDRQRPTEEGIPAPPGVVETTPTADGRTPREHRDAAQRQAEAQLGNIPSEEGDQGRSPDARADAEDAGTGSAATYAPEGADARREQPRPTAEREGASTGRSAVPPHFFVELKHQAFYHDVIVYVEGQEISDYLIGSISVTYGLGSSPNKCEFKIDNAGHKFTLTPENLQEEKFRAVEHTRGLGNAFDYAETAKKEIFDRKKNPEYNPVDSQSGGRRFPLHHWSTIFHKNDSVRVWIHNPASERDEWLPVFTGYVVNKPVSEDYITGENTVSVTCQDIRYLMSNMRVNTNSVLAVLPGQQTTRSADPTNSQPFTGLRIFTPQANQQFNRSFFVDLTVASAYDNPWSTLRFRELVAALTFLNNVQALVRSAEGSVQARINASRRQELETLSRQISPLQQRIDNGETLNERDRARFDRIRNDLVQAGVTVEQINSGEIPDVSLQAAPTADVLPSETERAARATDPGNTPSDPPGTGDSGGAGGGEGTGDAEAFRVRTETAPPRGAGRIGRLRPGVFPWFRGTVNGESVPAYARSGSIYPDTGANQATIRAFWQNWYNLCLFGSPRRKDTQSTSFAPSGPRGGRRSPGIPVEDGPLDHSINLRRYWTEQEVHTAGEKSRREGLWQTDTQAVHMIMPSRQAPTSDLIFEAGIITQSNVQSNLNWTNRLSLLNDACDNVDYRFWVSGTGDLIFEFAQYDFDPRDYGAYEEVLTLDHHLLNESFDEEGGEVITAVVANGSYVGLQNVDEQQLAQFIPRSVGVWSPNLASRHGLNVRVKNYPQIVNTTRLNRLAMLEFQKLLAAADEYQIGVAFRPWLLLNKPIFNKYRDRFALIDGIRWTLPITAGAIAGHSVPTYSLTLNYSRSVDEIGIPRFITGGPSQPMYFGERRGGASSILSSLTRRINTFEQAIRRLRSSSTPITIQDLQELRDQYGALLPERQDSYNVIDAALQPSSFEGRADGEESATTQALRAAARQCEEVVNNADGLTQDQVRQQLAACEATAASARESIREEGQDSGAPQGPDGTQPDTGRTGVRSTLDPSEEPERPREGPPPDDTPCHPGDPEMYSHPLGRQTLSVVPRFGEWRRQLARDLPRRRRSDILDRFGRGGVADPFEGLSSPVGVFQNRGDFPRIVTSGFGKRGRTWHTGSDLPATLGDPVFSCADGICIQNTPGRNAGGGLAILHAQGFVTFYRHLGDRLVELGETVKRNQQIATVGLSGSEPFGVALTHLHFECSAIANSPAFRQYVGSGKRFRIVTGPARSALVGAEPHSRAALTRGIGSSGSRRALLDAVAPEGRDLASTRVVNGLGSARTSLATVSPELRDRFNLSFLRYRQGSEFTIPRTFLQYNPACVGEDPFSRPEQRSAGGGGHLITQRDYLMQFGLKGIPTVKQPLVPTGSQALQPVPEIPESASGRRRTRLERQRAGIILQNERRAQRLAIFAAQVAREQALYVDTLPPEECPPERYEGSTPRQPGEPLPERRRITRAEAGAAYRTREGSS